MGLEIKVLGRVDLLIDGRVMPLGGSKPRAVLAMLALRANRTVSADDLIDGLWGERPPATAAKNVQLYVSRLRKALEMDGVSARIVTRGRGYELQVAEDAVDAVRFGRLVEQARREAEQGLVDGSVGPALELWHGAPLADVAEEPFAPPEIRRLEELHLRAVEMAIDAELAAGRPREVIAELESLIAEHPTHERFHAQRMLALYRAGRQSDASEAYREASRTLVAEIGAGPGPELRDLEEAILRQDPALDGRPLQQELPRQLEGGSPLLAGRDRELRWLRKRWQEAEAGRSRVALVGGPEGIGKTRLAAELAAEVQRSGATVLYVAGIGSPNAALEAIRAVQKGERPTLVVLDDADDASPSIVDAAASLAEGARDSALLLLVLYQDKQGPPAFADSSQRLELRPLRADAAAEIAELYAPADGLAMPHDTLMAESEGVPLRIHQAASGWAQAQVAERLEAAAAETAIDQHGLRTARAKVAGSIAELQSTRERRRRYVEEPPDHLTPEVCPFRGLAPFDAAHAEYFFGRERLVADLVARLVGSTLIAVVGPSGSGKSSAIRAGLLPSLAEGVLPGSERWRQGLMRPGGHPVAELTRTFARIAPGDGEPAGVDPLAFALEAIRPGERIVLAVDQLEEIFTACRDEGERAAFVDTIVSIAADPEQRTLVVLGLRADFYGQCAEYPELAAQMSANNVLVGPMRREELRRAVELPARRAGLRAEPSLVSALVGDVADEPGGLPLLSTTLVELWEERSGRTLRRSTYERSGGVSGAVARLAERAYARLSPPQRERARAILLRLTDAEQPVPVRRRVALSELETERDEEAASALAVLTESRLVTVDEGTVEVAHEALLREWPRLRAWLAEDIEGRRLHQHLINAATEWQRSGRDAAEFYRGARLASALDWAASHDPDLNEREREFLEASREASEREAERQRRANRRLRALLAGAGVLLIAAVIGGVIAVSQRQEARSAARAEAAQRLGTQALTEDRLDQALRLASAGLALDDSVATRSNLLSTLLRSPAMVGVLNGDGEDLGLVALSPDGGTLAVGDSTGTVIVFDTVTRQRIGEYQSQSSTAAGGPAFFLAFSPAGDSIAAGIQKPPQGLSAEVHIIDARTQRLRTSVPLGGYPGDPQAPYSPLITYSSDGRSLIVGYSSDSGMPLFVRRFDVRSGSPISRAVRVGPGGAFSLVHPTSDGRLLYASPDTTFAIDAETLRVVRRYPGGAFTTDISPDEGALALGDDDGTVRLLDLASGHVQRMRGRHDAAVSSEAFSPDGRTLATGGEDGTVIVWDLKRGRPIESLEGHTAAVFGSAFSPDGRTLYTASDDSRVIIWDVAGDRRIGREFRTGIVQPPDAPDSFPPAFAVSPDGLTLATARLDGRVDLIDAETLVRTGGFKAFDRTPATAIEYSPDGERLAVGGGRGLLGVWDARSGRRLGALLDAPRGRCADPSSLFEIVRCHGATYQHGLAFGPGDLLASASIAGEVRIWDLESRQPIRPPLRLPHFVLGLGFSPDGSQLAVPFGFNNPDGGDGVEILDVDSGERVARLRAENEVRAVAFSPDGGLLATSQIDGTAQLWETDGWRRMGPPLSAGAGFVVSVDFSPDGRTLATSHDDGTVGLWDVESQELIGSPLPGPGESWSTAGFSPEGGHLFAVDDNRRAIRWEVDPDLWRQRACTIAGGGFTPEQWDEIVPERDYIEACPSG